MTYVANGTFGPQLGQCLQHLWRDLLAGRCEGVVDIEEADGLLDGAVLEIGVEFGHGVEVRGRKPGESVQRVSLHDQRCRKGYKDK